MAAPISQPQHDTNALHAYLHSFRQIQAQRVDSDRLVEVRSPRFLQAVFRSLTRCRCLQQILAYSFQTEERLQRENEELRTQLKESHLDLKDATKSRRELQQHVEQLSSQIGYIVNANEHLKVPPRPTKVSKTRALRLPELQSLCRYSDRRRWLSRKSPGQMSSSGVCLHVSSSHPELTLVPSSKNDLLNRALTVENKPPMPCEMPSSTMAGAPLDPATTSRWRPGSLPTFLALLILRGQAAPSRARPPSGSSLQASHRPWRPLISSTLAVEKSGLTPK